MSDALAAPEEGGDETASLRPGQMVGLGCLTLIVLFAVLELGLRLLALGAGAVEARRPNVQDKFVDHPFLTIEMRPNYREVIPDYPSGGDLIFETNSHGFRGPEFETEKPADTYRIVVLGGSAVVTASVEDRLFSVELEDLLNERIEGRNIEVVNAGVPGYTSMQELFLVETQVLEWQPDMVLVYDGRNDMLEGSMPTYIPYWNQRNQDVQAFLREGDDLLRKHLFSWDLISRRLLNADTAPEREYNTPRAAGYDYQTHDESLDVYRQNLTTMAHVLDGYGIEMAMAYQPSILTSDKTLTDFEQGVMESLVPKFAEVHGEMERRGAGVMGEVAESQGVPWLDLSGIFDDQSESMFMDDVHQQDAGNPLIAAALADLLAPIIEADTGE